MNTNSKAVAAALSLMLWTCISAATASAQNLNLDGSDGLIEILKKTPATSFDIGISRLQLDVTVTLLVNKPEIFRTENFGYLVVEVDDMDSIDVQVAHGSAATVKSDLMAECSRDIELIFSSLSLKPPLLGSYELAMNENKHQMCMKVESSFPNLPSMAESGGPIVSNLCSKITIWAHVQSSTKKMNIACKKRFYDETVETWVVE